MKFDTIEQEAKFIVNILYQPTGYIKHNENSDAMWDWSKQQAINMIEHFINKMPEGSSNWLYHVELVAKIRAL